jgi:hypothetical protein
MAKKNKSGAEFDEIAVTKNFRVTTNILLLLKNLIWSAAVQMVLSVSAKEIFCWVGPVFGEILYSQSLHQRIIDSWKFAGKNCEENFFPIIGTIQQKFFLTVFRHLLLKVCFEKYCAQRIFLYGLINWSSRNSYSQHSVTVPFALQHCLYMTHWL